MKYQNNMKQSSYLITLLSLLCFTAFGQDNLVDNGSFEDQKKKPKKLGAISYADNWYQPTAVKTDLFTSGKVEPINVPTNVYGTEEAKDGDSYAGLVIFSYGNKVPRSYIGTRLNSPLKKGQKYCVQFSISLAEGSKYACNKMGAVLSKKELTNDSKGAIITEPSIVSDDIQNAIFGWQKVCGTFIAEGNEKYLTIGNFNSDEDTKSEKNKPPKGMKVETVIAAYYYIDEVKVVELTEEVDCSCGVQQAEEEVYSKVIYQKQVTLTEEMSDKEIIQAQELYFGFGSAQLTPLSAEALDLIAMKMKADPNLQLVISGHSDAEEDRVGEEKALYADMANKRIESTMKYLSAKGIATDRLIPSPKGNTVPNPEIRAYDEEEIAQAKNRRVVFEIR